MHVVVIGGWAPSLILFRLPLLAQLVARGHRVTALAADVTPELCLILRSHGVDLQEIPLARAGLNPRTDVQTLAALVRALRSLRPDVSLGYTIKPVIYGTLAARLAGVPRRFAMITGLGFAFMGTSVRRRLLRATASALYRLALSGATGLFLQNEDDLRDLRAAGALPPGLAITQVRGSGVDLTHYAKAPVADTPPRFLFIGRLLREKGIHAYVELARHVRAVRPETRFAIVGGLDPNPTSVSRSEVEAWVADGVVEYVGELADVRPELHRSHVLVLPSAREGTPRSVLEAMSIGRPVIVSDVPGSRDTIVDGEHGLLVPHGDASALTAAALRLIDDRALRARMGNAARTRVEELYDATKIASQMLSVMGL